MALQDSFPSEAKLYLQPTGFCPPDYARPGSVIQISGLPVWAMGLRVIARGYDGRIYDAVHSVEELRNAALPELSAIMAKIERAPDVWEVAGKSLRFDQTRLMAVVNVTPDSFSDGGDTASPERAIVVGQDFISAGADIIDVGGESTRPGAKTVWEGEELERVLPVLQGLAHSQTFLSIDTRKAAVMQAAVDAGADIINDVSALTFDPESLGAAVDAARPVILMHAQGDPQSMQKNPHYGDVVLDIFDALEARVDACLAAGIPRNRIAIDPGIGFGKSLQHNLALINNLAIFHGLGCPVLLGVSRKRFIGALSKEEDPKARGPGSLAAALHGLSQGVHILRVHDVADTRQALDICQGLSDQAQMPPAIN